MLVSLSLSGTVAVHADTVAPTRAEQITAIANQYNPIFDSQYARLIAIAAKAKTHAPTYAQYKAILLDFNDVRRIINDGLISSVSDLDAVKAYAEEESGEFAISIPGLEIMAKSITTITCTKGKLTKKVTSIKPLCPKGYTKKKK